MTNTNAKIFWPFDSAKRLDSGTGYLVGWVLLSSTKTNNTNSVKICVATVVSTEMEYTQLDSICETIRSGQHPESLHMNRVCTVAPEILGIIQTDDSTANKYQSSNSNSLWMELQLSSDNLPQIKSLQLNGSKCSSIDAEIIVYQPPNLYHLQFFSLDPIVLDLTVVDARFIQPLKSAEELEDDLKQKRELSSILHKINLHTRHSRLLHESSNTNSTNSNNTTLSSNDELKIMLEQLNCSYELDRIISLDRAKNKTFAMFKDPLYGVYYFVSLVLGPLWKYSKLFVAWPIIILLFLVRLITEWLLMGLNWKPFETLGLAFKDISSTGQQVDLRLQQMCLWPWQWMLFRRKGWRNSTSNRSQYISFFNSMWLVANDIIMGIAIGAFLVENDQLIAAWLNSILKEYSIDYLHSAIVWLMGWPSGLKLNSQLDSFLGKFFLGLIEAWATILLAAAPQMVIIIRIIGLSGALGATMILSTVADLLKVLTCHVYVFYSIIARLYNWQFSVLYSLFNLFRGRKYNILRNRIDHCDYDLDQLLLGTILFTLLFFLFPTVVVYYLLFCLSRIFVTLIQIGLHTVLAVLNHFPLFAMMLRLKDPWRLPGGIRLDVLDCQKVSHKVSHADTSNIETVTPQINQISSQISQESEKPRNRHKPAALLINRPETLSKPQIIQQKHKVNMTFIKITNIPVPASRIFFQYLKLWRMLTSHFISMAIVKNLIVGNPIKPLPVLQYPMLPRSRPTIQQFWTFVVDSFFPVESD